MAYTYGATTYATLINSSAKTYEVRVGYEPQEYSITNNTTPVNLILQVRTINAEYYTYGFTQTSTLGGVKFGGKTFSVRTKDKWVTFASTTITVTHNDDGTYSGTVSGSFTTNTTDKYALKSGSASVQMTLPTIPRATTPTIDSTVITMGSSATITLAPASGTFKHKLKYSFGGVANLTSGLSIGSDFSPSGNIKLTFTPPVSLGDYIPTATGGHAIITCTTYDANGSQIGEPKTITVTINVPSYTPTISISIKGNDLLSGVYVQGKSTATYTITAKGNYGSTIQAYTSTLDGVTYSGSSFTTNKLSSGTKVLSVTVVDSRGKSATANAQSIKVEPYSNPSITSFTADRGSDETTVVAKMTGSVASVGGKNTSTLSITLNGETKTVTSGSSVTFTGLSTELTYTAVAKITDAYTTVSKSISISTVDVTLDFNASGKGVALGKVSEKDAFEIDMPVEMLKDLDMKGNKIVNANLEELLYQSVQIQPLFMESIEELEAKGDTSKLYVLPDNFIYAYKEVADVPSVPTYTNLAEPLPNNTTDTTKWVNGYRYASSGITAESGTTISNLISCKGGDVIRVKGVKLRDADRIAIYFANASGTEAFTVGYYGSGITNTSASVVYNGYENEVYTFTIANGSGTATGFRFAMPTPTDVSEVIITKNEKIEDSPSGSSYTNLFDKTDDGFKEGYRFGSSGNETAESGTAITNYIPIKFGQDLHIKGIKSSVNGGDSYLRITIHDENKTYIGITQCPTQCTQEFLTAEYDNTVAIYHNFGYRNGSLVGTLVNYADANLYIRIGGKLAETIDDIVITVDQDIVESDEPIEPVEPSLSKAWTSTGHAFVPTEYDSQIASLTSKVNANAISINTLASTTNKQSQDIEALEASVEILEESVGILEAKIENIGTTEIPLYWKAYLDSKIDTIKNLHKQYGKDCFSFVLMADTHYPSNLGKVSPLLTKEIMDECDIKYALCVGDMQTRGCHKTKEALLNENNEIMEMFNPIINKLLMQKGNHDGAYGLLDRDGDGTYNNSGKEPHERESYVNNLTQEEFYDFMYRKVGMVGNVHFDDTGTAYYIDDTSNNVRYIGLNTQYNKYELQADGTQKYPTMWLMRFTQSQFNFLINEALVENTKDKTKFVLFGHVPLTQEIGDREVMQGVLNAFKNKTTYSGTYNGLADYDKVSVNVDFRNAKGTLVGYFHGHTHVDSLHTSYGFNVIGTRCDGHQENDRYNADGSENTSGLWHERVAGTTTEQSFDVFTVTKDKIYATKIGAGSDREISY